MATANPTLIHREDDNYEIELRRVREKIRAQFGDLTDRLKCRERELLEELDVILATYRSYQDECESVRGRVRDLEMMKQRMEEELATSRSKNLQENFIKQIEEEVKTIIYPEEPQLVSFVCEKYVIFSEIDKLGKLVEKVTDESWETESDYNNDHSSMLLSQSNLSFASESTEIQDNTLLDDVITSPSILHSSQFVETGLNLPQKVSLRSSPEELISMFEPLELTFAATTQVLTPAVIPPFSVTSTQGIRIFFPPPRPKERGYGNRGRVIPLRLNCFPIEIPNTKIHMYHIDVFNDTLKSEDKSVTQKYSLSDNYLEFSFICIPGYSGIHFQLR